MATQEVERADDAEVEYASHAGRRRERSKRPDGSYYSRDSAERMRQLQEDGKVGPQFGKLGGRPRKPRAAELIAENARKHADEVWKALYSGLDEDNPVRVRQESAMNILRVEREEAHLQIEEDKLDDMPKEQLIAEIREAFENPMILATLGIDEDDVDE